MDKQLGLLKDELDEAIMKNPIEYLREYEHSIPVPQRIGEWECNFPDWDSVYTYADTIIERIPDKVHRKDPEDLLYAIAMDNECEIIADRLSEYPEKISHLLKTPELMKVSDAKWLLSSAICKSGFWSTEIEEDLYRLYFDRSYYTQRRIMMDLARKQSRHTLELVNYAWQTHDEYQRMSALAALADIEYGSIQDYIEVAKASDFKHLRKYALELEEKEIGKSRSAVKG